ncbi:modular serine protease [Holotrichia oblita]|uniref:Modular serine protease n=1 Tax=Holotrichia oblita TaxID=644536 RepID=A0ACB9SIR5_HOLOL|nr:modular serine protease [Holotrichia oblita]
MPPVFILLGSICFAIPLLSTKTNAQQLESPCPRLFVYEPPGAAPDKWYGIVTLVSDYEISGVWLRIILDNPSLQLGNWFGEVKTEDNKLYRVRDRNTILQANKPLHIRFYVKYDPSKPIPRLESLRLNGKTICPEGVGTAPPTSTQLYTNKELYTTSPAPTLPSRPAKPDSDNDDDYFKGDFPGVDLSPTDDDVNVECGTLAIQASPLFTYAQKTKAGQFPWHAALYHSSGEGLNYTCGGSLISRYHVVTAAHCVTKPISQSVLDPDNLLIYLGKYYLKGWSNPGVQTRHVTKIIRHPQYSSEKYANDVAVIRLHRPVEFTEFVRPVCLWEGNKDIHLLVGESGAVVGWGYDETGRLSDELKMLNMPIIDKEKCIYSLPEFYSRFTNLDSYCAGFINGTSACNGDSGGGMVFKKTTEDQKRKAYHLRGLVSLSVALQNQAKCDATHYVVFTDVAKYLEFIKEAMMQ